MPRTPDERDAIDPAVWSPPEMRAALAARDVAIVYRRLQRSGVSQRRIAALTGQSQSEILGGRKVLAYGVRPAPSDRGRPGRTERLDGTGLRRRHGSPFA